MTEILNDATENKLTLSSGSHNRLLFRSLWWYPYHSFDEWDSSDTAVSGDHWFFQDELGTWMWTNDSYYPWFYHDDDDEWLEFLTADPFLTFWNDDQQTIQAYSYWEEVP